MVTSQWIGLVMFALFVGGIIGYAIREKEIKSSKKYEEWVKWMDKQNGFIDQTSRRD